MKETFEVNEPSANSVELVGDFTCWEQKPVLLKRQKNGIWRATVSLEPGVYEYRFRVDGDWRDDANSVGRRPNPFGSQNCLREVSP